MYRTFNEIMRDKVKTTKHCCHRTVHQSKKSWSVGITKINKKGNLEVENLKDYI